MAVFVAFLAVASRISFRACGHCDLEEKSLTSLLASFGSLLAAFGLPAKRGKTSWHDCSLRERRQQNLCPTEGVFRHVQAQAPVQPSNGGTTSVIEAAFKGPPLLTSGSVTSSSKHKENSRKKSRTLKEIQETKRNNEPNSLPGASPS